MRKTPSIRIFIPLLVLILCPGLAANAQETNAKGIYAEMPIEVHLVIADIKLDELIRSAEAAQDTAKAQKLQEASSFLKEAERKYDYFRRGDINAPYENWVYVWGVPRPDFPSVGKSPLSLLEHLWIGWDMAAQLRASIMIASVQYSTAEAAMHKYLDDSLELMEKAVHAVESTGVWVVHWLSEARLMISAPPEFKPATLMKSDQVRLLRPKPDGSPQSVVFVAHAYLDRGETDMTPEQYREKRIEKARRQFPDMSQVELGETGAEPGAFTTSFSYQYTWEGELIKALVHTYVIGSNAYETNYVSVTESFDRAEADRIIRSFLRR
jgi:hypothetical protein